MIDPKIAQVIATRSGQECVVADAIAFLNSLPGTSIDLLFCSPPYLDARTYGIDAGRRLEEWLAWMMEIVRAAMPRVKGVMCINCEGQQEDYAYQPAPEMLTAAIYNAGFNLRKSGYYIRQGIPGSGGRDYFRNDCETIITITQPGRINWSDNKAFGHAPKCKPGGEMSNRLKDGKRANEKKHENFRHAEDGSVKGGHARDIVDIANPGSCFQEIYTAGEVAAMMALFELNNISAHDVGGGLLGHALAHKNEAPFHIGLPRKYILSFCPPEGVVCDIFSGSGTTMQAAFELNRAFVGCDVRPDQVETAYQRKADTTRCLF